MRPFYYPLLVLIAFAGLAVVAANMRIWEQTELCTRCGRVRESVRVAVFGTPFDHRIEEEATAFTSAWPGALTCIDHVWQQTDYYNWRTAGGGYPRSRRMAMSDSLRTLLDSPGPALKLNELDPKRAQQILQDLIQEANEQGGYWAGGSRWVMRQTGTLGATEALIDRLRQKGMTREELRQWEKERAEDSPKPR